MQRVLGFLGGCVLAIASACVDAPPIEEDNERSGLALMGYQQHIMDEVEWRVIGTAADGLNGPRDLDFNPENPGELWVVNQLDDSTSTFFDVGTDEQSVVHRVDSFAMHFMEEVASISFRSGNMFATCQESRNTYNNQAPANNFMGPSLWPADLDTYSYANPEAVDFVGYDLGSHLDMLHESPLCMGIEWMQDNAFWTFDGYHGSISLFDFVEDHGVGFDDHSDGIVERYVEVEVARIEGIPSHLVYDRDNAVLFVADTGNERILRVDTSSAVRNRNLPATEPGVQVFEMAGAVVEEWANNDDGLDWVSGIDIHDGVLYFSDTYQSRIYAYDVETGEELDYLDTGLPERSLMGIRLDELGNLYYVDNVGDRLFMLQNPESL